MTAAAGRLRADLGVARLSVAAVNRHASTFRIVAWDGKGLFGIGTELPLSTSTQVGGAAQRGVFASSDFEREPGWNRPTDRMMQALGFRSGCSVAIGRSVVSLSSDEVGVDYTRRIEAVQGAADELAALLRGDSQRPHVLICQGDDLVGEGLARIAERRIDADVSSCLTVDDVVAAIRDSPIDVVVADASFDGQTLEATVELLRGAGSGAPVLAVPARDTPAARLAALAAGADGYVSRGQGTDAILQAVLRLRAGDTRLRPIADGKPVPALTRRERETLGLLDEGLRFKQIGAALGISEATAKGYARSLFRKLDVTSRAEAVFEARRVGLLELP